MYMYKFPLPICSFIVNTTIVWFGGEGTENLWRARFLHDKHFAPDRVEVDPNNITLHPGKNHVRGLVTEYPYMYTKDTIQVQVYIVYINGTTGAPTS